MREVFGVTTRLFLAFGVAFELPVVVFFLSAAGIVSARQLLAWSPYSVLFAFVAGAVLTPADVVSQVFLAVPLVVLYFVGIGAAWLFGGRRARESATDLQTQ
jgi:sec-independent protein translocase protein TatC